MAAPIALQLYSVRTELGEDFEAGVRRVAAMGYVGVETAGFPGSTPEDAGKLFKELWLVVPSAHTGLPVGDATQETLAAMNAIDCNSII